MLTDLRFALRSLTRTPTVTAIAVLCLAIGIGANAAIFGAVRTVLLHPLPIAAIDRLVVVQDNLVSLDVRNSEISAPEAVDIAQRRDIFEQSAAFTRRSFNLTGWGEPRRVEAVSTLGDFFSIFELRPHLGRFYEPGASTNGESHQVVLAYRLWRELTGGDRAALQRTIQLDGESYEVVGVLASGATYPRGAELFFPFVLDARARSQRGTLDMVAVSRLAAGVSIDRARAGMRDEAARWRTRGDQVAGLYARFGHALSVVPFVDLVAGGLRNVVLALMAAVVAVLLIACANVACLQLIRGTARARDLAVRAALGAQGWELARPLLLESAALTVAGGAAGLLLGLGVTRLIARSAAAQQTLLQDVRYDAPVLVFAAAMTAAVGLLFGVMPAVRASRAAPRAALQDASRGTSAGVVRHRTLYTIVVAQIAMTMALLLGSGVVLRSLRRLLEIELGFRPTSVLSAGLALPWSAYPSNEKATVFFESFIERLRSVPGVDAVGITSVVPLSGQDNTSPFQIAGRAGPADRPLGHANMNVVSEGYFRAMAIPVLRGRVFSTEDRRSSPPVVVIDERLAKQFFSGENPIGQRITQGPGDAIIIGVVGAITQEALGEEQKPTTYYSFRQLDWLRSYGLILRTRFETPLTASLLRRTVRESDPNLPLFDVRPMDDLVASSLGPRRFAATVMTGFGGLSLLLAALGVYGVVSYTTAQRTREFGVRIALGATPRSIAMHVLLKGAFMIGVGLLFGTVAFFLAGRLLGALLYGVGPRDPLTVALSAALLALVGLFASYLPAREAGSTDPADSLRLG